MDEIQIMPALVGVAAFLGGLWMLRTHYRIQAKRKEASGWSSVSGDMLEISKRGMGNKVIGDDGDGYHKYFLDAKYRYHIDGKDYEGTRIVFGGDLILKQEVNDFCEQYQEGQPVKVLFNPQDPGDAVLMLDRPGGKDKAEFYWALILMGVGVMLSVFVSGLYGVF